MKSCILKLLFLSGLILSLGTAIGSAQRSPYEEGHDDEFFVQLDSFVVYGGEIDVIDGLTGGKYRSGNKVVRTFYNNMPKIMGGFHRMLLAYESANIDFRIKDWEAHAEELAELAASFGIRGFRVDVKKIFNKEITIYSRLRSKPFFHLDELVVWELDALEPGALPDNRFAKNIRFDSETETWRRRALTHWVVDIENARNPYTCNKVQGLDLDSQKGFHELDIGLPGNMRTNYFKDVKLSYPIIVDRRLNSEEQIDYLQRTFIKNLRHLYDPFSWVTRRYERFNLGFARELRDDLSQRGYKVKNRQWFDRVMSSFLNDVITVRRHGYQSIYRDIATRVVHRGYDNQLGVALDLLNWQSGEERVAEGNPPADRWNPVKTGNGFESPAGARFILLDAYLRSGDKLVDALRQELKSQKKREDAIVVFKRAIEKASGVPADRYIDLAFSEQETLMSDFIEQADQKRRAAFEESQLELNLGK